MKKITSLLLTFLLVFTLAAGVQAQTVIDSKQEVKSVWLNEEKLELGNNSIYTENDVNYIPLRNVLEQLNYTVKWDSGNRAVIADKYGNVINIQIGSNIGYVNDTPVELDVAPKLVNGKTYASLGSLTQLLSINVEWDSTTQALHLMQESSQGYFWKVEKDGVVVHILGSIHVGNDDMYPIRDEIEEAFYNADNVAVEVNILEMPDQQTLDKIVALQGYSDGKTLKDHVSAETYERLQTFLADLELPTDSYDEYKAWAVLLDINSYLAFLESYQGGLGIDVYFLLKAMEQDKPILELESYLLQYSMFDSYSKELVESQINAALDLVYSEGEAEGESTAVLSELASLWIEGDDEGLEALIKAYEAESKEEYGKMILERHPQMIERIEGYLNNADKESYFVIVGYLHTLGKDGLIALLKQKGYDVTRL